MAISPNRAEARLSKTMQALTTINATEAKIRSLLEDQDQRQVRVTLLDNQISDLKGQIIPEKIDAPPNPENAAFLATIDTLEKEKAQIVVVYGEASTLLKRLGDELDALRVRYPHPEQMIEQQRNALERKQAAYPRLLIRHLYKCKAHGWTDARMAKLTEHRTNLRAERRALEAKLELA
jgi:chromosome segregation ATPase